MSIRGSYLGAMAYNGGQIARYHKGYPNMKFRKKGFVRMMRRKIRQSLSFVPHYNRYKGLQ